MQSLWLRMQALSLRIKSLLLRMQHMWLRLQPLWLYVLAEYRLSPPNIDLLLAIGDVVLRQGLPPPELQQESKSDSKKTKILLRNCKFVRKKHDKLKELCIFSQKI